MYKNEKNSTKSTKKILEKNSHPPKPYLTGLPAVQNTKITSKGTKVYKNEKDSTKSTKKLHKISVILVLFVNFA